MGDAIFGGNAKGCAKGCSKVGGMFDSCCIAGYCDLSESFGVIVCLVFGDNLLALGGKVAYAGFDVRVNLGLFVVYWLLLLLVWWSFILAIIVSSFGVCEANMAKSFGWEEEMLILLTGRLRSARHQGSGWLGCRNP